MQIHGKELAKGTAGELYLHGTIHELAAVLFAHKSIGYVFEGSSEKAKTCCSAPSLPGGYIHLLC